MTLTRENGVPLDDGKHRHVLMAYENPRGAAERLLKRRAGVSTEFNRTRLAYADLGKI